MCHYLSFLPDQICPGLLENMELHWAFPPKCSLLPKHPKTSCSWSSPKEHLEVGTIESPPHGNRYARAQIWHEPDLQGGYGNHIAFSLGLGLAKEILLEFLFKKWKLHSSILVHSFPLLLVFISQLHFLTKPPITVFEIHPKKVSFWHENSN